MRLLQCVAIDLLASALEPEHTKGVMSGIVVHAVVERDRFDKVIGGIGRFKRLHPEIRIGLAPKPQRLPRDSNSLRSFTPTQSFTKCLKHSFMPGISFFFR
jgi:hypothetical protein